MFVDSFFATHYSAASFTFSFCFCFSFAISLHETLHICFAERALCVCFFFLFRRHLPGQDVAQHGRRRPSFVLLSLSLSLTRAAISHSHLFVLLLLMLLLQAFEELEELLARHNICIAIKEKLVKDSGVAEDIAYDNIVQKLLTKPRARGKCHQVEQEEQQTGATKLKTSNES